MHKSIFILLFFYLHSSLYSGSFTNPPSKMQAKKTKQKRNAILQTKKKNTETISTKEPESPSTDPVIVHFKNEKPSFNNKEKEFCNFTQSLELSPLGIELFFMHTIKKPGYKDFISYNLCHLEKLLEYAIEEKDDLLIKRVITTFSISIYQTPFITADTAEHFLKVSEKIIFYLHNQKKKNLITTIQEILQNSFKENYTAFLNNPYQFFKTLTKSIVQKIESGETSLNRLNHFIETVLQKTMWTTVDEFETWQSYIEIIKTIKNLYDTKSIHQKEIVQRWLWIITQKYCSFLELTGEQLSLKTIEKIKKAILTEQIDTSYSLEFKSSFSIKEQLLEQILIEEAKKTFYKLEPTTNITANKL